LKPGDGVVFDEGRPDQPELGGRVFAVLQEGAAHRIEIIFGRNDLNIADVPIGSVLWKTDDPEARKRLEQTYARDVVVKRAPITVCVHAAMGKPLQIVLRDERGREATVTWDQPLERALKHPLSLDVLREQFGRLGGTPFELRAVEAENLDPVMVPKSVLNDLRRQAVESLMKQREAAAHHPIAGPDVLSTLRQDAQPRHLPKESSAPQLCVLVRGLEQLDAVLGWQPSHPSMRPALAYGDLEDPHLCEKAVARSCAAGVPIGLATLRIIKPGEEDSLKRILDLKPDCVLLRNLSALSFFREHAPALRLVGDFSLNVANDITADLLIQAGLARIVPSYDLNWQQMAAMVQPSSPDLFEVVIHQHVPMFHMEHCLFAACLSKGRNPHDCGRPCRHKVELRDRVGAEHPLLADAACRNTVFNAVAQSAAEFLPDMLRLGLRRFRMDLLRESAAETISLLECYVRLLAGLDDARASWRRLRELHPHGLTRGTLTSE
jgi:putative protease